jgi:hypothetical protein
MKWFLGTYTARFNRAHGLSGHLFSGRYKALLVDARGEGYMATACAYVHLNPVRAGLLRPEDPLRAYQWSSYPAYLVPPVRRPAWLRVDRVLGECGIPRDDAQGRKLKWIAARLHMGTWTNVSALLTKQRQKPR